MTETVLFVTKRHTSGKDVIEDRFGRYYHLACGLGRAGFQVVVSAADYRGEGRAVLESSNAKFVSFPLNPFRAVLYYRHLSDLATAAPPTVVVAGGDTHFGWFGRRLVRRLDVPFVFDVFDNYEAFRSAAIPGFRRLFRNLIDSADLVTVVTSSLTDLVSHDRVKIIPNGVDASVFYPRTTPLADARGHSKVGYVGGVAANRGIETLIEAVALLRENGSDIRLLLAGPRDGRLKVPGHSWIQTIGAVPQDHIPEILAQLDVAVLPYPDTDWARHTSPYKLVEYLSCQVPSVVTRVSNFERVLGLPDATCRPDDPEDMARAIRFQLDNHVIVSLDDSWTWESRARDLACALKTLVSDRTS